MSQIIAISDKAIVVALNDYVAIQEKLIAEFQKQYHSLSVEVDLLKQPKSGVLSAIGEKWKFQKHGVGIAFEGDISKKIIDINRGIINYKKAFDSWRLAEYFESSNCFEVTWKLNTFTADDDDDLDRLFELLKQANIIKLVSTQYKLYEMVEN